MNHKESLKIYDRLNIMMIKLKVAADHPSWDYGIASRFKEICIRLQVVQTLPEAWKEDNIPITVEMVDWLEERMPQRTVRGRMYLWLIEREDHPNYQDYYESAVVVASTISIAQHTHPRHGPVYDNTPTPDWMQTWIAPDKVKITCLGVADRKFGKEGEIILTSFIAG